jgi:ectoine hydroxylase-related dioxygenase (phytanoyl-CoA dioxygenase family)
MVISNNALSIIHEPYALTEEQKSYYRQNGFIRLKDIIPIDVLAHYTPFIEAAVDASGANDPVDEQLAKDAEDPTYSRAFKQVINIWAKPEHAKVRELAFSQRLARIAAELMSDDINGVRMYHDQALFKWPGGGHTPYHADQFYWPLQSDKTVTAWIPLTAVPIEMGPLEFVAGL